TVSVPPLLKTPAPSPMVWETGSLMPALATITSAGNVRVPALLMPAPRVAAPPVIVRGDRVAVTPALARKTLKSGAPAGPGPGAGGWGSGDRDCAVGRPLDGDVTGERKRAGSQCDGGEAGGEVDRVARAAGQVVAVGGPFGVAGRQLAQEDQRLPVRLLSLL